MLKHWFREFSRRAIQHTAPPMMIMTTMVFGVTMVIAGLALWDEANGAGWLSGWTLGFGLVAIIAAAASYFRPWYWKGATFLLGVPGVATLAIAALATWDAVLSPGVGGIGRNRMSWGLGIGAVCLVWGAFVATALVRDHRSRFPTARPTS